MVSIGSGVVWSDQTRRGDQLWIGCCFGRSVSAANLDSIGFALGFGDSIVLVQKVADLKNPPLGSRKPQKPGPLGGVGVGCGLRRVIDFLGVFEVFPLGP